MDKKTAFDIIKADDIMSRIVDYKNVLTALKSAYKIEIRCHDEIGIGCITVIIDEQLTEQMVILAKAYYQREIAQLEKEFDEL